MTPLPRVACLGDSITEGVYLDRPYPTKLSQLLGVTAPNYGVSGNTIAQMRTRWDSTVYADPAPVVAVMGGSNDCVGVLSDYTTIWPTLRGLFDAVLASGKRLIAMTPPPRGAAADTCMQGLRTEITRYVAGRREVATLADIYDLMDDGAGSLSAECGYGAGAPGDGLHPSQSCLDATAVAVKAALP